MIGVKYQFFNGNNIYFSSEERERLTKHKATCDKKRRLRKSKRK